MKPFFIVFLAFTLAPLIQAAPLREAEFTRVINDVKLLPDQAAPHTAAVGDKITGKTAVSTGTKSRAELKFGDGTLTRLGANSIFSIEQGSRNIDLQQGTFLLQVPKQMGGARVRTAAITAAVTGTTIMVEYEPNGYVKVIVLEGSLDLFRNDKPSVFRTIGSGDMVIMKPDGKTIPEPVQVDLQRLKKSSKLTNDKEFAPLHNERELNAADHDQQVRKNDGELLKTALVIPGQGTSVTLTSEARQQLTRLITASATPVAGVPAARIVSQLRSHQVHPPLLGGQAVINDASTIITDPSLSASFSDTFATGQGRIYKPAGEGTLGAYLYSKATTRAGADDAGAIASVDVFNRGKGPWASFLVEDLVLSGQPTVNSAGGPKNLILASDSNLQLTTSSGSSSNAWNLNAAGHSLNALTLAARGDITWDAGFSITGTTQDLLLYTQADGSGHGDISITSLAGQSAVSLPGGSFTAVAAGDVNVAGSASTSQPTVQARDVQIAAGGAVNLTRGTQIVASRKINVTAALDLHITSSSVLKSLADADVLGILLASSNGNVTIDGSSSVTGGNVVVRSDHGNVSLQSATLGADVLKVTTLSPTGQILIGNSTLTAATGIKLYAQGANGTVRFVGNSTLDGPATLAGNTVLVDSSVNVDVTTPNALNVYANQHQYNDGTHGNFRHNGSNLVFVPGTSSGPHQGSFNSRPGF
ncbi:MAG: FecR family protein [Verrucomicrobiaceae bacterium]|nr:FecR family protein [Verrucomicrobiaceae bacterium]